MAYYNYKLVRDALPDYITEAIPNYEGTCDYDGDMWVAASNYIDDLLKQLADLKAEREADKERLDWLSIMLLSDTVDVGIALYAGSKLVDTVCKHLVWVSSFSDNDTFDFSDDFGEGATLREAIDAAILAGKERELYR